MANIGAFNPNAQAPLENFINIPKGEWNVKIVDSKIEGQEQGNPKIVLTLEVDEGSAKGGKADVHLFLWSAEKKGEISRRKMTSICMALGIMQEFQDTNVLHGRPFTIKTDLRFVPKQDGTGMMEFPDVKAFLPYVGPGRAAGADPIQPQPPAAQAAPAAGAPTLPTFGQLPQAPGAGAPAMPAQPFAPPAPPASFAPPMAPAGMPAAPGAFAPPPMGAPAAPQYGAPPVGYGQAPAPYAPPVGAPPPFGAPQR